MHDLLVLGSGVAGLSTALAVARAGMAVIVLTKGELASTATRYAQGGVAAALAAPDSPDLHQVDTMVAGAGLCDADAVRLLVHEGPNRVRELAIMGARFDSTDGDGRDSADWLLAREGGHSLARVVHAGGDATGAEIERALVTAVERSEIEVREGWLALDMLDDAKGCAGVVALGPDRLPTNVRATDTVVATGGAGQCFAVTTNPTLSTGDGIALALRAGVACADLEFVQFHPTALHANAMPRPLLSEALRGEGAILRVDDGTALMAGLHPLADLAPRDVVSRAVAAHLRATGREHVWLDATMIADLDRHFPTIWAACRAAGLDPRVEWLPVAPAAHYTSGGIVTDLDGASSMPGLWACGETACSGVHGANRLASNSLLDGLVFGHRVVDALVASKRGADETGAMRGVLGLAGLGRRDPAVDRDRAATDTDHAALLAAIQRTMTTDVGVVRDASGLDLAAKTLADLGALETGLAPRVPESYETANVSRVSRALVASAMVREESRGSHTRSDFPESLDAQWGRWVHTGGGEVHFVPLAQRARGKRR